jgi:transposase
MRACSIDLRERVVAACVAGDSTREQLAARFSVGVPWIRKLLRQRRQSGSIAPGPHGGGHPRAFDAAADDRPRQASRGDAGLVPDPAEDSPPAAVELAVETGVHSKTSWGERARRVKYLDCSLGPGGFELHGLDELGVTLA